MFPRPKTGWHEDVCTLTNAVPKTVSSPSDLIPIYLDLLNPPWAFRRRSGEQFPTHSSPLLIKRTTHKSKSIHFNNYDL